MRLIYHSICQRYFVNDLFCSRLRKTNPSFKRELNWLDMTIIVKKSRCLRIGPRFDVPCANIITLTGHAYAKAEGCVYEDPSRADGLRVPGMLTHLQGDQVN